MKVEKGRVRLKEREFTVIIINHLNDKDDNNRNGYEDVFSNLATSYLIDPNHSLRQ